MTPLHAQPTVTTPLRCPTAVVTVQQHVDHCARTTGLTKRGNAHLSENVVAVVAVVAVDAIFSQDGCFCQQATGINWQTRPSTPKRRPKNAALSSEKTCHHRASQPCEARKSSVKFSKRKLREAKLQPEASTEHASPVNEERRATLQDSSLPQRRKCVQFVQTPSTDAEHVSKDLMTSATKR